MRRKGLYFGPAFAPAAAAVVEAFVEPAAAPVVFEALLPSLHARIDSELRLIFGCPSFATFGALLLSLPLLPLLLLLLPTLLLLLLRLLLEL